MTALLDALTTHLASGGPAPGEVERFAGKDFELLRALCRGHRARSRVAADELVAALARGVGGSEGTTNRVIQNSLTGTGSEVGAGSEGTTNRVIQNSLTGSGAEAGAGSEGTTNRVIQNSLTGTGAEVGVDSEAGAGAEVGADAKVGARSAWRDELAGVHEGVMSVVALEEELATFAPLLGVGWHKAKTALTAVVCERLGELRAVLSRAPELRRVAELFGRQRMPFAKGLGAERGGRVTAVGVKVGGGLEAALPSELALLADPDTEDLFLARLLERRLVSLELSGDEIGEPARPKRRGPAIVLVDTSGSMIGRTAELGKALALAVVERLTAERRAVEVVLFGGEGAMRTMRFAEQKTTPAELFDFLMASFHGGTDFDGPILWALDRIESDRRRELAQADLMLVTDGRARLSASVKARIQAARKQGLALYAAYVDAGLGFDPRGLLGLVDGVVTATPSGLVLREETR